jgi:[acyl-carrier-protein] S-malonyltransferase
MTEFAMLFPGQGSQSVGMLAELAADCPEVQATFSEAGEVLDMDLWTLVAQGPAEELNRTELTQPAMLAGGIAVWRVWQRMGGRSPRLLAGHSLGEYAALVAAQAMDFAEAVQVVAERGRLMQAAVPAGEGAMAAILGLADDVVEAICREAAEDQVVAPANYNSPGQLVIAGDASAVERAMHKCRDAGAKRAMVLPVSVPSHCELMRSAADGLAVALDGVEIRSPQIPVLHNVDVQPRQTPEEIRQALIKQMSSPVRWTETIQAIAANEVELMAECGPGRVLSGLGRRIERAVRWAPLEQIDLIKSTIADLENPNDPDS